MRQALLFFLFSVSLSLRAAQNLEIYWADTEGGAATLIVTPAGESVLIDSGNAGGRDAKRIFEIADKSAHLKQIDYLITTHYHGDHFGGAADLAGMIPIKSVYDNGTFDGQTERPSKQYSLFPAEKRAVINPGDEIPLKQAGGTPAVQLKCIGARQKFIKAPKDAKPCADCAEPKRKAEDKSDNANSIVMLLSFGDFRFFAGGDLTWNVEEKLVNPVNLVGTVDVYQVTHHGLDISNNPLVVKTLQPTVAVMSNGTTKGCDAETVATLKSVPSIQAVFQIHKSLKKTENAPDEFIANLEAKCDGNCIALRVDEDAKGYAVSIPATKMEKKFKTQAK
ncbi:MAG TPA: MBL fold metallo-hydrolase [Planctomycetota bacterium]|nr:MBL fold metallo-hydrolase [Planctomycetota bacterium]